MLQVPVHKHQSPLTQTFSKLVLFQIEFRDDDFDEHMPNAIIKWKITCLKIVLVPDPV